MIIIGLSGKKRSGKNQVAEFIKRIYFDKSVLTVAFADALKDEVAKACNTTVEDIITQKDTYREILQFWGTNYRRKFFGEDYWIRRLYEKLRGIESADIVCITDVRFQNEASAVKNINGYLVRINRPSDDLVDRHPSEVDLDEYKKWDSILLNNGTIDDLYVNTKTMLEYLHKLK